MEPRIFKYNPALLTDEELKAHFVVRQTDLALLLQDIRNNMTDGGNPNQHVMVIGPRGSGKTTLVLRAEIEIRQTPELDAYWYPLCFSEESYEVSSPGEFWLEALYHLARQTDDERWRQTWQELKQESDENRLRERALGQLLDFADEQKKRILLIVENMNMLFSDQLDDDDAWKIRHTLMHESRLMLLGTATSRFKEIDRADKAFYELFKLQQLPPLTSEECNLVWEVIAGKKLDGEKIRPIHILTGGNLRLLTIIAKFGAQYSFRQLMEGLTGLIDEHTEYFKSHLDSLAATERKVYLALAELWDPSSAREIAQAARLDVNKTSAFLKRLCEKGAVAILPERKSRFYMLAERMYNIYYLMRRNRTEGRVKATINFMIGMYGEEEARRLLHSQMESCTLEERSVIFKQFNWFDDHPSLPMSHEPSFTAREDGLNDLDSATYYGKKGDVYYDQFDYVKALEFYNKALAIREKVLGAGHPGITYTSIILTAVYLAVSGLGRLALRIIEESETEKYLEPLVAGLKLYLGEEVRVAHEIYEVAKDVKTRIEKRQAEMQKIESVKR